MQGKVPVGVTSVAGYTVTLAAVVGAVLAFLKGDRSDQTLGVLAAGGLAVLAFLSTQLGRYAQAHTLAKKQPTNVSVSYPQTTVSGPGANVQWTAGAVKQYGTDEPGEDAPPEADLYPLTDPRTIPPDVGDAEAEGTA